MKVSVFLTVDNMDTDCINQPQLLCGLSEDEIPILIRYVVTMLLWYICINVVILKQITFGISSVKKYNSVIYSDGSWCGIRIWLLILLVICLTAGTSHEILLFFNYSDILDMHFKIFYRSFAGLHWWPQLTIEHSTVSIVIVHLCSIRVVLLCW